MQFKDMELFRGLSAVEQSRLLGSMEKLEIAAGEMIFRQGEQGDSLYVVIAGSIELFTVDDDRREHVLTCLGEGETFGEMALLTGQPRSASARALTAAFLYKMDTATFSHYLAENSTIAHYLIRLLAKRLAATNQKLSDAENEKTEIVLKELARLSPAARKIVLAVSALPLCTETFILGFYGMEELPENTLRYLSAGSPEGGGTTRILTLDPSAAPIVYKLYQKRMMPDEKKRLLDSAVAFYLDTGRAELAVRLLAREKQWEACCRLMEHLLAENYGREKTGEGIAPVFDAEIVYDFSDCPDEILPAHKNLLRFLLEKDLVLRPEFGFKRLETVLQNMELFDAGEQAVFYKLAADYGKKLGLRQRSLEYLNMAFHLAGTLDGSEHHAGKKGAGAENKEREYGLAERNYSSAFGLAMAGNARKHLLQKNRLVLLLAAGISILFLGYFRYAAPFGDLTREAMLFIGIALAAVVFWIANVIPPFIVALLMALAWVLSGIVTSEAALSGFSSPIWLYMVCIFVFGLAISQSGLLYRLSLYILKAFPKNYTGQLLGLAVSGMVFTPLIPSAAAKVALSSSIAQSISESMGLQDRSKGSAGLGLCAMIFYGYLSSFFLTGSYINLMALGLAPQAGNIPWLAWLGYSLVTLVLFAGGMFGALLLLFRPSQTGKKISAEVLAEQIKTLGKLEGRELITAIVAVGVILMLVTASWHHLDSTWILLIGASVLVISGVLDNNSLKSGVDWPFLLFMGVTLSFVNVLSQFGIVQAMTGFLQTGMQPFMASPYVFLPVVVLLGFLVTLVIRDEPAVILLVLAMISIAGEAGIHPWVLILAVLLSTEPFFFPYQSVTYLTAYYSSQGKAFDHQQGQKLALCFGIVTIAAVFLSIPYWQLLGLIK